MSDEIELRISEHGMQPLILQTARQYANPRKALREYITNAVDAYVNTDRTPIVNVMLDPQHNRVIVSDFAEGMDEGFMRSLPQNIGYSIKRGRLDMRGEKAVGLVAFGSVGSALDLISRKEGDGRYNVLTYRLEGKGLNERIKAEFARISETDLEKRFCKGFQNGTMAVIQTNPDIFKRQFKLSDLRRFIQQTYMPLLFNNSNTFYLGTTNPEEESIIEVPKLKGDNLLNRREQNVQFNLFFNPNGIDDFPGLFSRGVSVYDSICQMDDRLREMEVWGSGMIQGFVNEPLLSLTLGRDGINQNSPEYTAFFRVLRKINDDLKDEVAERKKRSAEQKANEVINKAWNVLSDTIATVYDPLDIIDRPINPTDGVNDYETKTENGKENGEENGIRKRRKVPFSGLRVRPFGLQQRSFRSLLEDMIGKPAIQINSTHRNYTERVEQGDKNTAMEYLIDIASEPIAYYQTMQAVEQKKIINEPQAVAREVARRAQTIRIEARKKMNGKKHG